MSQDIANRSFLKSHALYKTVDNTKVLEDQRAMIAKRLDESLAARNKLCWRSLAPRFVYRKLTVRVAFPLEYSPKVYQSTK